LVSRVTQRDTYGDNPLHIVPAIDSHQTRESTPHRYRGCEKNDRERYLCDSQAVVNDP
jgi:hypothetical protein